MARVAILGASGSLGGHLLARALAENFDVHALTRDTARIRRTSERVTVFKGDAETGEGLEDFLRGCPYIISAIGTSKPALCLYNLVKAAGLQNIARLVVVSCLGVGDSLHQSLKSSGVLSSLVPRVRRSYYADLDRAEHLMRQTDLPYVLLRSTRLTQHQPGYAYPDEVVSVDSSDATPPGRIARSDLAQFIVHVLTAEGWARREVTVGSKR